MVDRHYPVVVDVASLGIALLDPKAPPTAAALDAIRGAASSAPGTPTGRPPPPAPRISATWPRSPGRPSTWVSSRCSPPTGTWCEDAWLVTSALIRETTRLKFLVAFRLGFVAPTLTAQMAATFQRISGGRLALNVVTGGDPAEQRRFGDFLDHDARYARTGESSPCCAAPGSGGRSISRARTYASLKASERINRRPILAA